VRYLVSFGASALAVPLVATIPPRPQGFVGLFAVLAALAVGTLVTAWFFPRKASAGQVSPAPAPAAE
jgi:hypothetical protein